MLERKCVSGEEGGKEGERESAEGLWRKARGERGDGKQACACQIGGKQGMHAPSFPALQFNQIYNAGLDTSRRGEREGAKIIILAISSALANNKAIICSSTNN